MKLSSIFFTCTICGMLQIAIGQVMEVPEELPVIFMQVGSHIHCIKHCCPFKMIHLLLKTGLKSQMFGLYKLLSQASL